LRVFVYISYKGTYYHGWQMQNNSISIQQVITESLQLLLKDNEISITASGRTDAGVHALEQVFHVNIPATTDLEHLSYRLNGILSKDIVVNKIVVVNKKAHARFDASLRSYEYHLRTIRTPFSKDEYYFHRGTLDYIKMNEAASFLLGVQDFESLSKVKTDVNNFVCEITRAEWIENEFGAIFYISANRFLRGMVRTIVGTLLLVGEGKMLPEEIKNIIKKKDRRAAGSSVAAKGLYLCKVEYPTQIFEIE